MTTLHGQGIDRFVIVCKRRNNIFLWEEWGREKICNWSVESRIL